MVSAQVSRPVDSCGYAASYKERFPLGSRRLGKRGSGLCDRSSFKLDQNVQNRPLQRALHNGGKSLAETEHSQNDDPDVNHLRNLSKKGASNVVGEILKDPTVQELIKNSVLKETFKSGLIMAAFFLGLLNLYNTAKTVFNMGWAGDFVVGLALTGMGSVYMLKNFMKSSQSKSSKS